MYLGARARASEHPQPRRQLISPEKQHQRRRPGAFPLSCMACRLLFLRQGRTRSRLDAQTPAHLARGSTSTAALCTFLFSPTPRMARRLVLSGRNDAVAPELLAASSSRGSPARRRRSTSAAALGAFLYSTTPRMARRGRASRSAR